MSHKKVSLSRRSLGKQFDNSLSIGIIKRRIGFMGFIEYFSRTVMVVIIMAVSVSTSSWRFCTNHINYVIWYARLQLCKFGLMLER